MLDLSSLAARNTADIPIEDPVTGEPSGAVVTVAGVDSPQYATCLQNQRAARLRRAQLTGKANYDQADMEKDTLDLLVACTVGWSGVGTGGTEVPFSPEAARELYGKRELGWFRDQVDRAIGNRANFIKR